MVSTINATSSSGIVSTADNSTTLGLQTNGTTALYVDASQNVGIGTSSPNSIANYSILQVGGSSTTQGYVETYDGTTRTVMWTTGGVGKIGTRTSHPLTFQINSSEVGRFDTSGNLLIGGSSLIVGNERQLISQPTTSYWAQCIYLGNSANGTIYTNTSGTAAYTATSFRNNGTTFSLCGSITVSGTTTSYATSSDYRLKENVKTMTNGLETVSALNPVSYDWVHDKSKGEGFIAHELQAIIPAAVIGEKDAVDEKGNPEYQGVDYSKIVVHLVAAIQELSAEVKALKAKVGA